MSDLHKSKRHDLIDMFNDTSRYLDDIFTINNPKFEKYIPDIYPAELQLNKANTLDKETSFLDLNIKVIGRDIHHCGQSITACSMRLLFTFSPGHILRSVCLQFIAYKDNT